MRAPLPHGITGETYVSTSPRRPVIAPVGTPCQTAPRAPDRARGAGATGVSMSFETLDFLTDSTVLGDPSPYYAYLREQPARRVAPHDVVAVSGYDELVSVFRDTDTYSMCNTAS